MKKKDIITLAVCSVFIIGAFVVIYFMFFPPTSKATANNNTTASTVNQPAKISGNLDQDTLNKINDLKNYVSTNLDNIGRTDPFGPLK